MFEREREPVTTLSAFSSANAVPTGWEQGRKDLQDAQVYWLSTVRADGRPHVAPLLGVWLAGALYFCTGPNERKAKNLAHNPHCILTTGSNRPDGLDLVVEGAAAKVSDKAELRNVADTYESKYGAHFTAPEGTIYQRRQEQEEDQLRRELHMRHAGCQRQQQATHDQQDRVGHPQSTCSRSHGCQSNHEREDQLDVAHARGARLYY